jgi:hypothetical protein
MIFGIILSGCGTAFKNVRIPKPKDSSYLFSQVEPSIAMHPDDPSRMIVGTVMDDYHYSVNGGKKWKSFQLKSKFGVYGDPVMLIDNEGRNYYFHLSNYSNGSWLDRIVCQKSDHIEGPFDEGTFTQPNGKVHDKHWVAYDPERKIIHMTWTQFDAYKSDNPVDSSVILYSRSMDRGETWSVPKRISSQAGDCLDGDNTVEGATPAVGPNGEVYVAWTGPQGIVFNVSHDFGETWLKEERLVANHPGGWDIEVPGIYRCNGLPVLSCDRSDSPNRGNLYINWSDQKYGENDTDIWVIRSEDGGLTWNEPVRVNDDPPGKHQFFTWMTVDQSSGILYTVFFDRRNHEDWATDVFLAYSKDGGKSFKNVKISEKPFYPNPEVFFGDYNNIASVQGEIRPVWPRIDGMVISLWTALIREKDLPE